MKFIALLSGGKDSIFATLQAVKYGHELTVIGNLYPELNIPDRKDGTQGLEEVANTEIDSYMFQTVGVELVPLIAECMDKPLISHIIRGGSWNQELFYQQDEDGKADEVEDLYNLLKEAKEEYKIKFLSLWDPLKVNQCEHI
jgi:diphthine-ammonia ligase